MVLGTIRSHLEMLRSHSWGKNENKGESVVSEVISSSQIT